MKTEDYLKLEADMHRIARTFMRKWAWGRNAPYAIVEEVQAEALVRVLEEMRDRGIPYSDGENRSPELYEAMSRAASKAVNIYRDQLNGRDPSNDVTPYDPRSTVNSDEHYSRYTVPLEVKMAGASAWDTYFEEEESDELSIDFGDDQLNVVAQGLADGLSYTVIASRLGYEGNYPRQHVAVRVRQLRKRMTGMELGRANRKGVHAEA